MSTKCFRMRSLGKLLRGADGRGWLRDGRAPLRFQGGVARSAGVVSKKSRSLLIDARVALLILFEFTNHPVCAAEERDLFIEAQPPLSRNCD